jgi:peptidoglycan/LPS O-acetylase OafA/YrhL
MAAFTYAIADREVGYGWDVAGVLILAVLAALHFATGIGVARWWAIALPALAVLIAIPAGYPDVSHGEPLPVWMGLAFWAPAGVLLVALGVAAAQLTRLGGRWVSESASSRRSRGRSRTM